MTSVAAVIVTMFSVLIPARVWVAPDQPLMVQVNAQGTVTLVMTDFFGKTIDPDGPADVEGGKSVDVRKVFQAVSQAGTYLLYAVPKDKAPEQFLGTPLVIGVRPDSRHGAGPGAMITRIEPLCYVEMNTDKGDIKAAFFYEAAPNTVDNFLRLAQEGFYDGLTFHRVIVKPERFVIQGGDPKGDGSGGPGYHIEAEFNNHKHESGVLSMARSGDPQEKPGIQPRPEFANSAGSQFFICLDYNQTQHLDMKYTAFGKVVGDMKAVDAIASVPLADDRTGRPEKPPVIQKIKVCPVTAAQNPYPDLRASIATTQPK